MEDVYTRFGRELRRVRKAKGLTQDELAERVGLGRTSIVNIETGRQRVHLHTFLDLARGLGVSAKDLLPEEPPPVPLFADQLETLPAPERDWVIRLVAPPTGPRRGRKTDGSKT